MLKHFTTLTALIALLLGARESGASAQTQMQAPPAGCAHADDQLHRMTMPAMTPSGKLDTDVTDMMAAQEKLMVAAAKLEMRCGTDPAMKRHAAMVVQDAPRMLFSGGTPH